MRFAVYVYWDEDSSLRLFARYYLYHLKKHCDRVVVVINGNIDKVSLEVIEVLGCESLVRENIGYDFAAYQAGINYFGREYLEQVDELVLCNSSVYGPLYPLAQLFDSVDRDIDFWGITAWHGFPWPDHIQSYFVVFRRHVIQSYEFWEYWKNLKWPRNRDEAIKCCETQMTLYFSKVGFKWDVLIKFQGDGDNSMRPCIYDLDSPPFIKRKLFLNPVISYSDKRELLKKIERPELLNIIQKEFAEDYLKFVSTLGYKDRFIVMMRSILPMKIRKIIQKLRLYF